MKIEEWKTFDLPYQVSNFGRVRNLETGTVRKGSTDDDGYNKQVVGGNNYRVCRLVAKYFVAGYAEGLIVDHKDENRGNDHHDNLHWVTPQWNVEKGVAKWVEQLDPAMRRVELFRSKRKAATATGISQSNIGMAIRWKSKKDPTLLGRAGGYYWRYVDE